MRVDEKQHPDYFQDKAAFNGIARGSYQAADDAAIDAYLKVFADGGTEEEAQKQFSKTYKLHIGK